MFAEDMFADDFSSPTGAHKMTVAAGAEVTIIQLLSPSLYGFVTVVTVADYK